MALSCKQWRRMLPLFLVLPFFYVLYNRWDETYVNADQQNYLDRHDAGIYNNEKGERIDTSKSERQEQLDALRYIEPGAQVLEVGARYGTVSCLIQKFVLSQKRKRGSPPRLISVEIDPSVQEALSENLQRNGCETLVHVNSSVGETPLYQIPSGPKDLGYGSRLSNSDEGNPRAILIPALTLPQLQAKYNLQFDTIVADCEGCLEGLIRDFVKYNLISNLRTLIYEKDGMERCNYGYIDDEVGGIPGMWKRKGGFHTVWIRRP